MMINKGAVTMENKIFDIEKLETVFDITKLQTNIWVD